VDPELFNGFSIVPTSIDTLNLYEHAMEPPDASESLLSSMLPMPLYINIGHVATHATLS